MSDQDQIEDELQRLNELEEQLERLQASGTALKTATRGNRDKLNRLQIDLDTGKEEVNHSDSYAKRSKPGRVLQDGEDKKPAAK